MMPRAFILNIPGLGERRLTRQCEPIDPQAPVVYSTPKGDTLTFTPGGFVVQLDDESSPAESTCACCGNYRADWSKPITITAVQ